MVVHFDDGDYRVEVDSVRPMQSFTYRQYQRTNDADIHYKKAVGDRGVCP